MKKLRKCTFTVKGKVIDGYFHHWCLCAVVGAESVTVGKVEDMFGKMYTISPFDIVFWE